MNHRQVQEDATNTGQTTAHPARSASVEGVAHVMRSAVPGKIQIPRPVRDLFTDDLPSPLSISAGTEGFQYGTSQKRILHHTLIESFEQIRSVSERSKTYNKNVPYIHLFSNGTEWLEPVNLPSVARLVPPGWLTGTLFIFGPGLFDIEYLSLSGKAMKVVSMENWCDGLSLIHKFEFNSNPSNFTVKYKSRFLSNALEERIRKSAQSRNKEIMADPNQWIIKNLDNRKWQPDPSSICANKNLLKSGAIWSTSVNEPTIPVGSKELEEFRLIALGNYSFFQEIDPVTLIPKRVRSLYQLNDQFRGILTSNQVYDSSTGETIQCVMSPGWTCTYTIFSIVDDDPFDPPGHVITQLKLCPSINFQLALTKHYVILIVFPYKDAWKCSFSSENIHQLKFDEKGITWFHVIDRQKRIKIASYRTPAFYATRVINAFEQDQHVKIDLNAYETDLIRYCWNLRNLRTLGMPPLPDGSVRRYLLPRIPEASGRSGVEATFSFFSDSPVEFSTIPPAQMGKKYSSCYGLTISHDSRQKMNQFYDSLIHLNVEDKLQRTWSETDCYPGPPIFIPCPLNNGQGIVLTVVLDARREKSFLLALNGVEMEEIFRAWLPNSVPFYSSFAYMKQ